MKYTRVVGLAWAGEDAIAGVEVSVDQGQTWQPSRLIGPQAPYSWNLWEYLWDLPQAGSQSLLARANATGGRTQPHEHDPLNGGYLIHHSRALTVQVKADSRSEAGRGDLGALMFDMNAFAEENTRLPLDVDTQFSSGSGI